MGASPDATPATPEVRALQGTPLFSHLADDQVRDLAGIGRTVSLEAGHVVFAEGAEADGLYVILAGTVRIYGKDDRGDEAEFATLARGDYFGELALLDGKPRSATVACLEPCTLFFLDKET